MKTNIQKKIAFFAVILLFLASCAKDDLPIHSNYFVVEGEVKIDLEIGYIIDYGNLVNEDSLTLYHMHADFISSGIVFQPSTHEFSGAGNRLSVKFNAPEDHHISTGTYEFSSELRPFTFENGFIEEGYDYLNLTGHHHGIIGGTIIVFYNGSDYDFTYDCMLNTGKRFIGTFKGNMIYNDYIDL